MLFISWLKDILHIIEIILQNWFSVVSYMFMLQHVLTQIVCIFPLKVLFKSTSCQASGIERKYMGFSW